MSCEKMGKKKQQENKRKLEKRRNIICCVRGIRKRRKEGSKGAREKINTAIMKDCICKVKT
jgi:hypothetical protein